MQIGSAVPNAAIVRPDFNQNQAQQVQNRQTSSGKVQVAPNLTQVKSGAAVEAQAREVSASSASQTDAGKAPKQSALVAQAQANPKAQQQQGTNQLNVFA
ncbi:MAG: hypothetical protein Q9M26_05720 [Mariprofundales bacterium]|nr:hypothetical protein [Mariprofundales bacterium]